MLLRQASFGARACARATRAASVRMPVRTAVVSVEPDETPYAALLADRALTSRVSEPVRKRWIEEHARWTEYQAKVEEFVKAAMGSMGLSGSDVDSAADLLDSLADGADGSDSAGAASGLGLDPATVSILDGVPDEALNYLFRQRTRHFREAMRELRQTYPSPDRYKKVFVTEKREYHVKSQELRMHHTYDRGLRRRKAAFVKRLVNDTLRNAIYTNMKRTIPMAPVRYTPEGSRFPRNYYEKGDPSRTPLVEPFNQMAKQHGRQMVTRGYIRGKARKSR